MATKEDAVWYEEIVSDLRLKGMLMRKQLEKAIKIRDEQDEEITKLRKENIDLQDANLKLDQNLLDLQDQIELKGYENGRLRRQTLCEVEDKLLQENKELREKLTGQEISLRDLFRWKREVEAKNQDDVDVKSPMTPNETQELFRQMSEQYEAELRTLREQSDEMIGILEKQLEIAIADKAEISKMYLAEIERLDLALTEAVNQLAENAAMNKKSREYHEDLSSADQLPQPLSPNNVSSADAAGIPLQDGTLYQPQIFADESWHFEPVNDFEEVYDTAKGSTQV